MVVCILEGARRRKVDKKPGESVQCARNFSKQGIMTKHHRYLYIDGYNNQLRMFLFGLLNFLNVGGFIF